MVVEKEERPFNERNWQGREGGKRKGRVVRERRRRKSNYRCRIKISEDKHSIESERGDWKELKTYKEDWVVRRRSRNGGTKKLNSLQMTALGNKSVIEQKFRSYP